MECSNGRSKCKCSERFLSFNKKRATYYDWCRTKRWNRRAKWNPYSGFSWLRYDYNAEGSNLESAVISGLFKKSPSCTTLHFPDSKVQRWILLLTINCDRWLKIASRSSIKGRWEHFISHSDAMKLESTDQSDCPTIKKIASELSKKKIKDNICSNKAKQFKKQASTVASEVQQQRQIRSWLLYYSYSSKCKT